MFRASGAGSQHRAEIGDLLGRHANPALGEPADPLAPRLLAEFDDAAFAGRLAKDDLYLLIVLSAGQDGKDHFGKGLHSVAPEVGRRGVMLRFILNSP